MITGSMYRINERGFDNGLLLGDIEELHWEYENIETINCRDISSNLFIYLGTRGLDDGNEETDVSIFYHPQHGQIWVYTYENEYFELLEKQ